MAENSAGSPLFAGRYRFESIDDDWDIGRTGFTHPAFDTIEKRRVVIKRADATSPQAQQHEHSLTSEAQALKELRGLGVPELFDVSQSNYGDQHVTYLVMEYIEGIHIEKEITSLNFMERAKILIEFFRILAAAHNRGISNGDIDIKHLFWLREKQRLIVIDWGNASIKSNQRNHQYEFDIARSAEIVYSLVTKQGVIPSIGSLALPEKTYLLPELLPLPNEFNVLCQWAPRNPSEELHAPCTASELYLAANDWLIRLGRETQQQASSNNSNTSSTGRNRRFAAVRIQLASAFPSDFKQGIDRIRKWLHDSPDDQEIYTFVKVLVRENPALQDNITDILTEIKQKGSEAASKALSDLISNEQDLMTDADDAYYAADFDKAISLYSKVLQTEPKNRRAQQQLEKAELHQIPQQPNRKLPREAIQYYRRARSYIAAQDINSAVSMLEAAIEAAQAHHMKFQEAEVLLDTQQDMQIAVEYKHQADQAIKEEMWDEAIELLDMALRLDPLNPGMKNTRDSLTSLLKLVNVIKVMQDNPVELENKLSEWSKTEEIKHAIENAELTILVSTSLFRELLKYYYYITASDEKVKEQIYILLQSVNTKLSGEPKNVAKRKLHNLLDKNGNFSSPAGKRILVMQEVQSELYNANQSVIMATWPWRITTIGLIIYLAILASLILKTIPTLSAGLQTSNFILVLAYLALVGSGVRVARFLSLNEAIDLRKSLELLLLRPIIGLGVALIIILAIRAGLLKLNVTLDSYVYWAVSIIVGYSQPLVDGILNVLDGKVLIKMNEQNK